MLISKIIHFIWLGDVLPDYADYVMDAYRQVNPDFELKLTHRTIQQLTDIYNGTFSQEDDDIVKQSIERTLNIGDDEFIRIQLRMYGDDVRFVQVLSDVLRLELLNRHGGIYVDLDTFPIKPFDDSLLSNTFFAIRRFNGKGFFYDNYFMGKKPDGNRLVNPYDFTKMYGMNALNHYPSNYMTIRFMVNRDKFFKHKLQIGDFSFVKDFYIDHYFDGRWRNNIKSGVRVKKIFLDEIWKR